MSITQSINLDFGRNSIPPTVYAKQGDIKTRFVTITPLNCGAAYTMETGTTAKIAVRKADGHKVLNNATITDGIITAELTEQALAADGVAVAEIQLYKGDTLLTSQVFYIKVERSAVDSDAVESSDEFNALVEALNQVDNLNASVEATATGATIYITNKEGVTTSAHIDTLNAIDGWEDIRNAVRMGLGETLFPVGYEFTTTHTIMGSIIWVVRAHDHHTATNGRLTHTMTLEMKNIYGSGSAYKPLVFDAYEALYYAEEALSAGTYHFTFNYSSSSVVSGTYQFTLTQAVPAGGQILLGTNSSSTAITDCKISTYSEVGGTTAIESNITVTEGTDGTDLGTTGSGNLNHPHRILWGSNNYAQSALRQWLNSSADLGSVWTPTNKFDRAPSWYTSADAAYKGFMLGFDSEFLGVVQTSVVPCRTNSVYEVNSTDGSEFTINQVYNLEDKFFILSRPEMYGTWDSETYKDGELLDFYDGLTDTERQKFDAFGSVRYAWLRSPTPSSAYGERLVGTAGSLNGLHAINGLGVAAACIIA